MMVTVGRVILSDVVVHLRTRLVEWVFAAILAAFAYRLLQPSDTFATSKSYAYMASWMSKQSWGESIGVIATIRLVALTINGSVRLFRPWSPAVRAVTAWLSSIVWFCLTFGFYLSNPDATGWGTYGIIFIADLCLAITIAHDAGHAVRMNRYAGPRKR